MSASGGLSFDVSDSSDQQSQVSRESLESGEVSAFGHAGHRHRNSSVSESSVTSPRTIKWLKLHATAVTNEQSLPPGILDHYTEVRIIQFLLMSSNLFSKS